MKGSKEKRGGSKGEGRKEEKEEKEERKWGNKREKRGHEGSRKEKLSKYLALSSCAFSNLKQNIICSSLGFDITLA
jgi:hypothetical protein